MKYTRNYKDDKRHGKGKEYCNRGKLVFEVEYFNGVNWESKDFYKEGEYENGKWLNGKTYDNNGNIYEIKNGNGIVKEYYSNGKIRFEGEYLNVEKNGKVNEYAYSGKLEFEGEYLNGEKNGKAIEYDAFGEKIFEGEYLKGKKWNGKIYEYHWGQL